ncbi:MAG: DNA mismatch repair protein MutS [Candidatus Omnitrophica bacterium]|nr:DNA mismatch repair protein MutS [Candidatus Omnitrophota bacterium]
MTTATADSKTPKKLTPMMEQYRSVQKTLPPGTILFFRLGDFYEMFFEDALRASEILNITLTGREAGEAGRVPMCGIPFHSSTAYIKTLIENNLKVAICEQIGDPKAKGLVERKVTRIISPATYLEDESKGKDFEYMAALSRDGKECAIAFLELSTGEFLVRKVPAERMASELMLLAPREVILSKTDEEDQALMDFVRSALNATVTVYEDWVFGAEEGERLLQEKFRLAAKQSISFCDQPLALSSAGAVLYYLRDHLHASLDHVQMPALLESNEFMVLDRQTQRSLELVAAFSGEKGGPTLLSTIDQTLTSMGARTLYQWVTHPLLTVRPVEERQQAVCELTGETSALNGFRGLIKGVKDIERTLSRLNYGVANARDLVNLALFLKRVPEIRRSLSVLKSDLIKSRLNDVVECPDLLSKIEKTIVEEPPLSIRDGGIIREGVSAELDELRDISANGKRWILDFQKREIERTGIKSLRMKYSQVFGYTIEISKSNLHLVPEDYIRRQTLANAERFIVPELKTWDEKISGAQDKIKALEYQLFNELREEILGSLNVLQAMARAIGVLDCLGSLAMAAVQKSWIKPHVVETGELLIEGGRHPVVEVMLPAGKFVENDVFLDAAENQLVVLTGPNMAGKSTYIRQTALIVLLAQIGSFVPAKSARIGLVDRIFTRIGASDDLARGESTFMVEMVETAHILQKATHRSLLILDEVGRGTSTFDGVSIAWAICEYLSQGMVKPRTMFATHYHELTQLEDHFAGIKNYNITVRETKDGIMFLRKVVRGGSDRSYGIHVARLAGIPQAVTERAEKILKVLESENTEATRIIEGKKENVERAQKEKREPTLFDFANENHPVLEEIKKLSLDGMTPLQALNKLSELKERLSIK